MSFLLQGTWKCKGAESGTVFDDVEFEDGRWDDYDEKVSLTRAESTSHLTRLNHRPSLLYLFQCRRSPRNSSGRDVAIPLA